MGNWNVRSLKSLGIGLMLALAGTVWAGSIDLNSADAKALEALNGVGPAKAQAIVDYRTKNGPFKSVDDLEKVPGIGAATVAKNREMVTLGGGTKAAATSKMTKPEAAPK